jgi:acyl-CoA reductase-like NAD-dependent aldehyde dehydrogenase
VKLDVQFNPDTAESPRIVMGEESSVRRAFESARAAQPAWAATPFHRRLRVLQRARHLVAAHATKLAVAATDASARPLSEALAAQVLPLADACKFLEREAGHLLAPRRVGRDGRPAWLLGVTSEVSREPLGVVLIIAPSNYPLLLPGVQLLQALAAGNAVLLKPGAGGTAAARALIGLLQTAGLDARLVGLLPESVEAAQAALDQPVAKVFFTGSFATGRQVLAQLASRAIPAVVELSGSDAVIVRTDADLDLVVDALIFGLRLNDSATCIAPRRVFVARSLATELEGRLARALGGHLSLTPGFSPVSAAARSETVSTVSRVVPKAAEAAEEREDAPDTGLKPGANERHARLRGCVEEAIRQGAHLVAGALSPAGAPEFPLILAGAKPAMRLLREDFFAPVLSLITVEDDLEAVQGAADCPYALGATIFTRDLAAARALAAKLPGGVVVINDLIVPTADPRLPFCGRKQSGFGVTRGAEGLLEMTAPKVVITRRGKARPHYDPPQPGDEDLFRAYIETAHGGGVLRRLGAALRLIVQLARKARSPERRASLGRKDDNVT